MPVFLAYLTLNMEVIRVHETSVAINPITWRHMKEELKPHQHRRTNINLIKLGPTARAGASKLMRLRLGVNKTGYSIG
jgi:hypothetical protein